MNNKIMILSWCNADNVMNYGQILQAISMMLLARSNSSGEIIYISYHPRTIKNKIRCFAERHNPFSSHLFPYLKTQRLLKNLSKQYKIKILQIESYKRLEDLSKNCDLMVCGSDQIWHPRNYDPGYYLDFGDDKILRKSYAVSLPKSKIEDRFSDAYKQIEKSIKKMDYISVREESSRELISKLSGKNVDVVLDPTFLINKNVWFKLIDSMTLPKEYIFVYIPNGMDNNIEKAIDNIKNKTGIDNVVILMTRGDNLFSNYRRIKYVTIGQFLYLIKNSSFVFTTSFHAVVFSIIFEKNFSCYSVDNIEQGEDTRLKDILRLFNLESRLGVLKDSNIEIDYDKIKKILDKEIQRSKSINTQVFMIQGDFDGKE